MFHFLCLVNKRYAPYDRWLPWVTRRLPILSGDIIPLVEGVMATTDVQRQLSLYQEMVTRCAEYAYTTGLATRGQLWWADLRQAVTGELKDFPVPAWSGVEFRYASQFAVGDFREMLAFL